MLTNNNRKLSEYNIFSSRIFKELRDSNATYTRNERIKIVSEQWKKYKEDIRKEIIIDDPIKVNEIEYITGNILDFEAPTFIVNKRHINTSKLTGMTEALINKYPNLNIHKPGSFMDIKAGNILINNNIISIFAQINQGRSFRYSYNDDSEKRISYFKKCLEEIEKKIPIDSYIVFPNRICCGLSGGDWNVYNNMIVSFTERNPKLKVSIVTLPK